jgi:hypothetical protein
MFFIIFYYVRVAILLTFGKQLHDRIITLMFRARSTSLTPPHYIEVPIPSQENDESSIFVLEVSNLLDFNSNFTKNPPYDFLTTGHTRKYRHLAITSKINQLCIR